MPELLAAIDFKGEITLGEILALFVGLLIAWLVNKKDADRRGVAGVLDRVCDSCLNGLDLLSDLLGPEVDANKIFRAVQVMGNSLQLLRNSCAKAGAEKPELTDIDALWDKLRRSATDPLTIAARYEVLDLRAIEGNINALRTKLVELQLSLNVQ